MTSVNIILDADGKMPELREKADRGELLEGKLTTLTTLPDGTTSGRPSVGFYIDLPDGRVVFAEMTLRMWQAASAAFRGRYGVVE